MNNCLFCNELIQAIDKGGIVECKCSNCGDYSVNKPDWHTIKRYIQIEYSVSSYLLSGVINEMKPNYGEEKIIGKDNLIDIINSIKLPQTLREKLDKIILFVYKESKKYAQSVHVHRKSIGYAIDMEEMRHMVSALGDERLLNVSSGDLCSLTVKGTEYAESLLKRNIDSTQCFVAMWFESGLNEVYNDYMKYAVEGKTLDGHFIENVLHYMPIRIDFKEFNEDILDEIIAEIRKSKFVVADFTGNRGGVYFEAGFAYGLGLNVIYTCRKDFFENEKVHFDVNHKNFLVWENGEDLYKKLRNRISATII